VGLGQLSGTREEKRGNPQFHDVMERIGLRSSRESPKASLDPQKDSLDAGRILVNRDKNIT
jgi:hypothetical protein